MRRVGFSDMLNKRVGCPIQLMGVEEEVKFISVLLVGVINIQLHRHP
jgi:hypothetical protein